MENPIIVPFDLNTARKIKSGEIEGSVLINDIEIEFVYESKNCASPYNLLFVKKDGYGISAIYANTEGCTIGGTTLELKVEAGAYFKKGDVLTSTNGYQFIYDGIITKGVMGCIYGMASFGDIGFDYKLWTDVYDEYRKRHVRKAIEEEKKFLAEKIIKAEDSRKIDIIKRYLSEYEYLLDEMPKRDFKPFERVLVRRTNQERWKLHLFSRESVGDNKYECLGGVGFSQCIPYEGNEHLLGTTENPEKMKMVKLSDFYPYDRNKGGIQELHHKIESKTLQYWGEDSGILIGITPIYKRRLWSEEVKVVNDKMTNMKTRTYEGVQHGDWVRCVLCGAQMLLPCGADKCPECSSEGTLTWVDEDKQEMDAKHLDCLVPIRKLELQEYLSPEILNMEHI